MDSVNPKLVIVLLCVIAFFVYSKVSNPYRKYGTEQFWENATVSDVYSIPEKALLPGNQNGPVLMWAAASTSDPEVITALLSRGADINERDEVFQGTPLSAAAYQNRNAEVIEVLIDRGAHVNVVLGVLKKSPLLLAAEQNTLEVTRLLLSHGADLSYRDASGKSAPMLAVEFGNKDVSEFYSTME